LWSLAAAFAAAQAPLYFVTNFSVDGNEVYRISIVIALMFLLSTLALVRYRNPVIGLALAGHAQMTSIGLIAIGYSYFAASLAMPLQDELFMAMDRALGLDWQPMMQWVSARQWRIDLASFGYASLTYQSFAVAPLLVLFMRFHAIQILTFSSLISVIVTVAVFAALPAVSTFAHLGIVDQMREILHVTGGFSHLPDLAQARAGGPLVLYQQPQGMVAFPSFHACAAVLLMRAYWQVPMFRWPAVALNLLMIAATPFIGSHYFVDVIAGIIVAIGAIRLACWLLPPPETVASH
jgi:membrane-associated phospholipid phosphatase